MNSKKMARQQRRAGAGTRRRGVPYTWIALAAGAAVVFMILLLRSDRGAAVPVVTPEGVQTYSVASRVHTTGHVSYPQVPPVGGPHAPVWQNCGFYDEAIPNETAVHSLEHGAVWITYRPDLPVDQVDILRRLAHSQTFILASPFPNLPAPLVASAWGKQLILPSAGDPKLQQFIRVFRLGPQTPEPGALCAGGVGRPN